MSQQISSISVNMKQAYMPTTKLHESRFSEALFENSKGLAASMNQNNSFMKAHYNNLNEDEEGRVKEIKITRYIERFNPQEAE